MIMKEVTSYVEMTESENNGTKISEMTITEVEIGEDEFSDTGVMDGNEGDLKGIKDFLRQEDGMGTVEIILIIVVLVGLVLIFKEQITNVVNNIFGKISKESAKV